MELEIKRTKEGIKIGNKLTLKVKEHFEDVKTKKVFSTILIGNTKYNEQIEIIVDFFKSYEYINAKMIKKDLLSIQYLDNWNKWQMKNIRV